MQPYNNTSPTSDPDGSAFGRAYASRLAVYEPEHDAAGWLHLRAEPVED